MSAGDMSALRESNSLRVLGEVGKFTSTASFQYRCKCFSYTGKDLHHRESTDNVGVGLYPGRNAESAWKEAGLSIG